MISTISFDNELNQNLSLSKASKCDQLYDFYLAHVEKTLGIIGLILNLICLYVFSRPCMHKSTNGFMIKYLLLKSILDSFFFFRNSVHSMLDCKGCALARSYSFKVFFWIFYYYLGFMAQMLSMFCEVMANFDRYVFISNRCRFYKKSTKSFYVTILVMVSVSSVIYTYKFLERDLVAVSPIPMRNDAAVPSDINSTSVFEPSYEYHLRYNDLANSKFIIWTRFLTSFLRDFLTSVVIFVLNIKTMNFMKSTLLNKKKLNLRTANAKNKSSFISSALRVSEPSNASSDKEPPVEKLRKLPSSSSSSSVVKLSHQLNYSKIERNITIMVVINGFVCIIGHFPFFIVFLPIDNFGQILGKCYSSINYTLFYCSYSINFFIYFFFNKKFQNFILGKVRLLIGIRGSTGQNESASSSNRTTGSGPRPASAPPVAEQKHLLKDHHHNLSTTVL